MDYFVYGQTETDYLKSRDPVLARAIEQIGPIRRRVIPDLFEALVHAIVGQQISTKAQNTIWRRMKEHFCRITPSLIAETDEAELQRFGISMRKAGYIRRAALKIQSGAFDLEALFSLPDQKVLDRLVGLDGVGVWTGEMLMIFSMQRPDILSFGDLAIRRGLRMLYQLPSVSREQFEGFRRCYSPYATVAGLYLWAVAGGAIPGLTDPAAAKPTEA